jgi:hypothetical protein
MGRGVGTKTGNQRPGKKAPGQHRCCRLRELSQQEFAIYLRYLGCAVVAGAGGAVCAGFAGAPGVVGG